MSLRIELGIDGETAATMSWVAALYLDAGDVGNGIGMLERALALAERGGDVESVRQALWNLAMTCAEADLDERARALFSRALAFARDAADNASIAKILTQLADIQDRAGNAAEAGRLLRQALLLFREVGADDDVERVLRRLHELE